MSTPEPARRKPGRRHPWADTPPRIVAVEDPEHPTTWAEIAAAWAPLFVRALEAGLADGKEGEEEQHSMTSVERLEIRQKRPA